MSAMSQCSDMQLVATSNHYSQRSLISQSQVVRQYNRHGEQVAQKSQSSVEPTWKALQYHEQICGDAQHLLQLRPGDGLRIGKTISAGKFPLQRRFCGTPPRLVNDDHHQCGCPDGWQGHNDKWPAPAQLRPCDVEETKVMPWLQKKCAQHTH